LLRKVECSARPEELAQELRPSDLNDAISVKLPAGEIAGLDAPPSNDSSPVGRCVVTPANNVTSAGLPGCVAAILETDTAQPVLMVARERWFKSIDGPFFSCERRPPPVSPCQSPWPQKVDPGPDAVDLSTQDGATQFRANKADEVARDSVPVRIAELDLDALRARTPAADGCRAMLDEYNELRTQHSCTRDEDCKSVGSVPFPSEPLLCNTFLNATAAKRIAELAQTWPEACTPVKQSSCPAQGGGHCEAGSCAPLCPGGIRPRVCPATCAEIQGTFDTFCALGGACMNESGALCSCVDHALQCDDGPQTSPCEMPCTRPRSDEDSGAAGSQP
jgi:hypothetical protein